MLIITDFYIAAMQISFSLSSYSCFEIEFAKTNKNAFSKITHIDARLIRKIGFYLMVSVCMFA